MRAGSGEFSRHFAPHFHGVINRSRVAEREPIYTCKGDKGGECEVVLSSL